MSEVVRRNVPLIITFIIGMVMVLEYYVVSPELIAVAEEINTWRVILFACVYLGTINLLRLHGRRVTRRVEGQWYFSAWTIFLIVAYTVLGLYFGVASKNYRWMMDNVNVPLGATMYASLCFYMAAGAYRVLRARNLGVALLLSAAVLVIIGNTPLFPAYFPVFGQIRSWIFSVFVTGSYRAVRIGVGLGGVALGIRTLFGLETGYLGRRRRE